MFHAPAGEEKRTSHADFSRNIQVSESWPPSFRLSASGSHCYTDSRGSFRRGPAADGERRRGMKGVGNAVFTNHQSFRSGSAFAFLAQAQIAAR
jgi:hypothetical protein